MSRHLEILRPKSIHKYFFNAVLIICEHVFHIGPIFPDSSENILYVYVTLKFITFYRNWPTKILLLFEILKMSKALVFRGGFAPWTPTRAMVYHGPAEGLSSPPDPRSKCHAYLSFKVGRYGYDGNGNKADVSAPYVTVLLSFRLILVS